MRYVGIDPATQTGFVALDKNGIPVVEKTFRGKGKDVKGGISPEQRMSLFNQLYNLLQPGDVVLKEAIANGNKMIITTAKIHGGFEDMITRRKLTFEEVAPLAVKKFVDVDFRTIDKSLKSKEYEKAKKDAMAVAALKHFNYKHPSDDVVDAFIIAKICEALYMVRNGRAMDSYPLYQHEVIWSFIDPEAYKEYDKEKQKAKKRKRPGKPAAAGSHTHTKEQQFLF